jgi:hypothetical protein
MKKSLKLSILAALLVAACPSAWAVYSIDYVTMSGSFTSTPALTQVQATGGGRVVNIGDTICPGQTINFSLNYSVAGSSNATGQFPATVTFSGVTTDPSGNPTLVVFTGFPTMHNFTGPGSTFSDSGTFIAPNTAGAYTVKILAMSGTGNGNSALNAGAGLIINFTVLSCSTPPPCQPVTPLLTVADNCAQLHQTTPVNLTATMTSGGNPVSGKTITFTVDGNAAGSAMTDANGIATATASYDVSTLTLGDHDVIAHYVAPTGACDYTSANGAGNLGITYGAITFQQPINADGSSIFKGGSIPVKIVVYDGTGAIVSDAVPNVFFEFGFPTVIGETSEAVSTSAATTGNLMRWDPVAMQYIFNWDITGASIGNGTYTIWIDLHEGSCGNAHTVSLSIQKVGKGIKK